MLIHIWFDIYYILFLLLPFRLLSLSSSKLTVIPRLNISSVIGFRKGSNENLYLKSCTWGKIELHKIVFFIDLTLLWQINILLKLPPTPAKVLNEIKAYGSKTGSFLNKNENSQSWSESQVFKLKRPIKYSFVFFFNSICT